MDKKKSWETPELIILIKRSDEEHVLTQCSGYLACGNEGQPGNPTAGSGQS